MTYSDETLIRERAQAMWDKMRETMRLPPTTLPPSRTDFIKLAQQNIKEHSVTKTVFLMVDSGTNNGSIHDSLEAAVENASDTCIGITTLYYIGEQLFEANHVSLEEASLL